MENPLNLHQINPTFIKKLLNTKENEILICKLLNIRMSTIQLQVKKYFFFTIT